MSIPKKLEAVVRNALPKHNANRAKIFWRPTGLGNRHLLRVITSAWQEKSRSERIYELQKAITSQLTENELDRIFRISVLTSSEYSRLCRDLQGEGTSSRSTGGR